MDKKFYITTPIYYPSAKPHMGHAYSSIIADFFARFKIIDDYADRLGLDDKNIFNCPVTIIDPQYGDDDNRLITTIFNPEVAAGYLTFIRERWKNENKKKNKADKRRNRKND